MKKQKAENIDFTKLRKALVGTLAICLLALSVASVFLIRQTEPAPNWDELCKDFVSSAVSSSDMSKIENSIQVLSGDTVELDSDSWISSDNTVAVVYGSSLTAQGEGYAAIYVSDSDDPLMQLVIVRPVEEALVIMSRPNTITDNADKFSQWSTDNSSVAVVNQAGIVNPISVGDTRITAVDDNGLLCAWNTRVRKAAYLTIDDWPNENTHDILTVLDEYDIKATFFLVQQIDHLDYYQEIIDAGHSIGNHTMSHQTEKLLAGAGSVYASAERMDNWLSENLDVSTKLFRFPTGSSQFTKIGAFPRMERAGYRIFDWSSTLHDTRTTDPDVCYENAMKYTTDDAEVILMHHKKHSLEALPRIIESLTEQGYVFLPLEEKSPTYNFLRGWEEWPIKYTE